ncbi:unnamed protein product [Protopolystoma xenopodis]|uniref:Mon2 C-terminal domain-containing protein n=1 Tax=Protopolystoma xenopodis TaxID=117903 RepID=A0A3S5CUR7_9PLAT|nr:unnamed protein product [Protopolystoma xenopodis]
MPSHILSTLAAQLRPFGLCCEYLSPGLVETVFLPIVLRLLDCLDRLVESSRPFEEVTSAAAGSVPTKTSCHNLTTKALAPGSESSSVGTSSPGLGLEDIRTESFSNFTFCLREFLRRVPGQEEKICQLEALRLKVVLRTLHVRFWAGY